MKHYILFILLAMMSACTKQGDPGAQGPAGLSGDDGNANVFTHHFSIAPQDWLSQGTPGVNSIRYVKLPFSELDSQMVSSGVVNVYYFENNYYKSLPVSWNYVSTALNFNFQYTIDTLMITAYYSNNSASGIPQSFSFKSVFVDGN